MGRKWRKEIGLPFAAVLLLIGVWAAAAAVIGVEIILPSPLAVLVSCGDMLSSAEFWKAIGGSTLRSLAAFGISFLVALALAIPAALKKGVERFLSPLVTILRSVPTISVIFIVMVFLPSGQVPVVIAFLIAFPMLYAGFLGGLQSVRPEWVTMSKVYRVPLGTQIRECYLPAMLPTLFTESRSAVGMTLKIVVAAEAIASTRMSLGRLLQVANVRLEGGNLLAYTLAAIAVSFLLEGAVLLIRKCVVRWEK